MSKETKNDTYTTTDGLVIKVKRVDPMFVQRVINSVKMPARPTYEFKTLSGRVENRPMDEQAAQETPGGLALWEQYETDLGRAMADQNARLMNALFLMGAECEIPNNEWESKWEFLGIDVPTKPAERKAFYLASELPTEDSIGLMSAILRLTGVSTEKLREAEDAFRNTVPAGE